MSQLSHVCSNCSAKINYSEKHAGRTVKCPKCQAPLALPALVVSNPPKRVEQAEFTPSPQRVREPIAPSGDEDAGVLPDRFRGKTRIYWAQLLVLGSLGSFSLLLGLLFWTGTMKDANGKPRPQAGPPMTIIGSGMVVVASMAAANIFARRRPLIRCFQEGIEFAVVGASSLDNVRSIPRLLRLAWKIFSLQGFRTLVLRIPWEDVEGVRLTGFKMAYMVTVDGVATEIKSGAHRENVSIGQSTLKTHPRDVVVTLQKFVASPVHCEKLPHWS